MNRELSFLLYLEKADRSFMNYRSVGSKLKEQEDFPTQVCAIPSFHGIDSFPVERLNEMFSSSIDSRPED